MSLIKCRKHNIGYCISHGLMCGCSVPDVSLKYRFTKVELLSMLEKIEEACKVSQNEQKPTTN